MEDNFIKHLKDTINQQNDEIRRLKADIKELQLKKEKSFFDFLNIVIADMPGYVYWKNKDSIYMGCNNNLAKISGFQSISDIVGKKDDFFEWGKKFIENDVYVIHTGKNHASTYELEITREDGHKLWLKTNKAPLKINNEIIGVIAIAIDVTDEQIEKKKALTDKKFIEDIIYSLPGLVYWKNNKSQYIGFNRNVVILSQLDRKSLLGKSDLELNWGAKEAESFIKDDKEVMETGKILVTEHEIPIQRPDGKLLIVRTEKSQLKNRNGDVVGVLGVAIDVTDQKEFEKDLILEKEKSEQANLLKTEFMRNMEHDIRTPFNGVWGMANYLWEIEQDETKKEYLSDITQCAKELLDYCNSILDFSKIESGFLAIIEKKFNLKDLISSVHRIELPAATYKKLNLEMKYDKDIPNVLIGDSYRVRRILINLISNAIKFTKEGYVNLTASLLKMDDRKALVRFTIEDTGIGIPEDKQEYIFEKFSRLSLSNRGFYKGIGLGLRVVKQFMNEVGGEIDLISEEAKGTQFICTIPFRTPLTDDFANNKGF